MIEIHPQKIKGNWTEGYALDFHTVSSDYIGDDEFGRPKFETKRTDMGELLYRLKYKSDKSVLKIIINTASAFIESHNFSADLIIPVPPSRERRQFQPVLTLAKGIGTNLEIAECSGCIIKIKHTPELKNIYAFKERLELLTDAYAVNKPEVSGKKVLLFDDLFRSGATLHAITKALFEKGNAERVDVVTLTRTRRKS